MLYESISFEQAKAREAKLYKQLTDKEKYIRRLAEAATVGMCNFSPDGTLTWANSKFFEVTAMSSKPEDASLSCFVQAVLDEDQNKLAAAHEGCFQHKMDQTTEVRLAAKWTPPGATEEGHRWIMFSSVANVDNDQVTGVIGCITDISHLKWAEQLQADIATRFKEDNLQQERFFDMTR